MVSEQFKFHNPVKIISGCGVYLDELQEIFRRRPCRIGLCYGQQSMQANGVIQTIEKALPHCQIVHIGGIAPNPTLDDLTNAVNSTSANIDWIIAIGGGSVLDLGKGLAFMMKQKAPLEQAVLNENFTGAEASIPLIAIPTTSGSGSEATPWATFWDSKNKRKHSLSHNNMFAHYAIIDTELTFSLPPLQTAICGFDALAHAFEAFWSKNANPISDTYAIEAIHLIMENLVRAIQEPLNAAGRAAMARASLFAGLAFSNTKTAAVHAVSYPFTLHFDIPHGLACQLILAEFWRFNRPYIPVGKIGRLERTLGIDADDLFRKIKELAVDSDLPATLKSANIPQSGIATIIQDGFEPTRVLNNPRKLTHDDLKELLERIEK